MDHPLAQLHYHFEGLASRAVKVLLVPSYIADAAPSVNIWKEGIKYFYETCKKDLEGEAKVQAEVEMWVVRWRRT